MLWNSLASASCAEFIPGEPYHMNTCREAGSLTRGLGDSPQGQSTWNRPIRRQVILPFGLLPEHLSRRNFLIPSADGSGTVYGSQFIAKLLKSKRDSEWELAVLSSQPEGISEHLVEFMERRRLEKVEIIEVDHTDPQLCYKYFYEELGMSGFVPNWDFYHNNPGYNFKEPPCLHVLHQRPVRGPSHSSSTSVIMGRGFTHHSHFASPGRFHSCNSVSTRPHASLAHYCRYKSQDQLHAEQVARQLQNFRLRQDDMAAESRRKALETIKFGFFDEAEKYIPMNEDCLPPASLPDQVALETDSHCPAATGCSFGIPIRDETKCSSIVGETTDSLENFDSTVLGTVVTEGIGGLIPKALLSGFKGSTSTTTHLVEAPVTGHYSSANPQNTAMRELITPFSVTHTDDSSYQGSWIDSTVSSAVTEEVIPNSLVAFPKPPHPRSNGAPKSLLRPEKASTWATIASHNASATGYTLVPQSTNQLSCNSCSNKLGVSNNRHGNSSTEKGTDPADRFSIHNPTPKKDTLNLNTIRGAREFFNQGSPRAWSWADEVCVAAATLTV